MLLNGKVTMNDDYKHIPAKKSYPVKITYKKAIEALERLYPLIEKEVDFSNVKNVVFKRHSKLSEDDET